MGQGWRTQQLPRGWAATRLRILERDNYTCYICGGRADQVDHVIGVAADGGEDDGNLAAICTPCHRRKTGREARRFSTSGPSLIGSRKRTPEPHPGQL